MQKLHSTIQIMSAGFRKEKYRRFKRLCVTASFPRESVVMTQQRKIKTCGGAADFLCTYFQLYYSTKVNVPVFTFQALLTTEIKTLLIRV